MLAQIVRCQDIVANHTLECSVASEGVNSVGGRHAPQPLPIPATRAIVERQCVKEAVGVYLFLMYVYLQCQLVRNKYVDQADVLLDIEACIL